jgi:hypothetical protein
MELIHLSEVTLSKIFRLGTPLLKCWVVAISRLSGDGLKEFSCTLFVRIVKMSSICIRAKFRKASAPKTILTLKSKQELKLQFLWQQRGVQ